MGAGKSTLGKHLAEALGLQHMDLDWFFEETYKISIMDFFRKYDEKAFRLIEHQLLKKTADIRDTVISTGGGTPCYHNNMTLINRYGVSVYIRMTAEMLFSRLQNSKRSRPLTSELRGDALRQRVKADLLQREQFYKMARIETDGENPDIEALARAIKSISGAT